MKSPYYIIIIIMLIVSLIGLNGCIYKKQEKRLINLDVSSKCSETFFVPKELVRYDIKPLNLVDMLCLDGLNIVLFSDNKVYENIKKDCTLNEILRLAKLHLQQTNGIISDECDEVIRILVFMDALRTYTYLNPKTCTKSSEVTFEYKKFTFDQNELKDEINMIFLILRKKRDFSYKDEYMLSFEYLLS